MLSRLYIENFALIDKLDTDFGEGLNILTGSTGAGKSIIIGALDLILGGRGSEEIVRTGETSCLVEGTFRVKGRGFAARLKSEGVLIAGDKIVIRREYRRKGGGRAFINDAQIGIPILKDISEHLADILGQHSHQTLLNPATHCDYLDRYAGLESSVSQLRSLYGKAVDLRDRLATSDRMARELADRIDLLNFQISDIEKAHLKTDEEEKLKEERKLLENAQKIRETADWVVRELLEDDGSAVEKIGRAERALETVSRASESIREFASSMRSSSESLRESVISLKNLVEHIDIDPQRLEEVNERLDEIFRLKKKYGAGFREINNHLVKSRAELTHLKSQEVDTRNLQERSDKTVRQLNSLASEISLARRKARPGLEKMVVEKLTTMGMPRAQFVIGISEAEVPDGLYESEGRKLAGDPNGFDKVEFQFCANPGEGLKPLAKIASGGEISRVMLALKNAFLHKKGSGCEVFDEIDVGISGDAAAKVARQLKELSKKHQVICITHLHQIASMADQHFRVFKSTVKGRSVTKVQLLDHDERVKEIAALLSGEKVSEKAMAGARELLDDSREDRR